MGVIPLISAMTDLKPLRVPNLGTISEPENPRTPSLKGENRPSTPDMLHPQWTAHSLPLPGLPLRT